MKLQSPEQYLSTRFWYIASTAIVSFSCILSYLLYLQMYRSTDFFKKSTNNYTRFTTIMPTRGNIVDCSGKLIATNRVIHSIYWQGSGKRHLTAQQRALIYQLKKIVDLPDTIDRTISIAERYYNSIEIVYNAPMSQVKQLLEKFPMAHNLVIEESFERLYPYHQYACHALGYVTKDGLTNIGKTGIERFCNAELSGTPGQIRKEINSYGKLLHTKIISNPIHGQHIETTLDMDIQSLLEELMPIGLNGAAIVVDPASGALQALVSHPSYDPKLFLGNLTHSHWQKLQMQKCFLNRATYACYPPASIFKLVTLAAALEENIIDKTSSWNCKGFIRYGGKTMYCGRRSGHGTLNTKNALAYSCNIPFYELAKKMSIDTLAQYANKLGLGTQTHFLLGESVGNVPTTAWKRAKLGEPWWPGESLSTAIGQSYLLVTPLQIAQMIGALYTGFIAQPRILLKEPILVKPIDISTSTLGFLKKAMASVAKRGTGRALRRLKNFTFFAKTGTAQTSSRSLHSTLRKKPHVWFSACFSYKNQDPKVLVILLEHAPSSGAALRVAYNFFEKYVHRLKDQSSYF